MFFLLPFQAISFGRKIPDIRKKILFNFQLKEICNFVTTMSFSMIEYRPAIFAVFTERINRALSELIPLLDITFYKQASSPADQIPKVSEQMRSLRDSWILIRLFYSEGRWSDDELMALGEQLARYDYLIMQALDYWKNCIHSDKKSIIVELAATAKAFLWMLRREIEGFGQPTLALPEHPDFFPQEI